MDNLYNSQKLCTAGYREKTLMGGCARTHGRGVVESVIQKEEKNKKAAKKLQGTIQAARLVNHK